jgi:hypothetical protein
VARKLGCECEELAAACDRIIRTAFFKVANGDEFLNLSREEVTGRAARCFVEKI